MELTKLSDTEIQRVATPIWNNIIAAANSQNYVKFSRDFSTIMLKEATQELIESQWHKNAQLTCLKKSPEYLGLLRNNSIVRVLWKQKFINNDEELLGHLELTVEQGEIKVDGAQIL